MVKNTATIKDIAERANVSVATVSRYLNSTGYVDASTAKNIAAIIDKLDYRPNRMAQSLKTKESKNIVLVVPDIQNPFYSRMANEVQHLAFSQGYTITLFDSEENYENEKIYIKLTSDIGADGIIFASASKHQTILDELDKIRIPAVVVNSYDVCKYDSVHGIRGLSTYLTTKHLIELGHRKIGFAGGDPVTVIKASRKAGFIKAMNEFEVPIKEEYIFMMGLSSDSGKKAGTYFSALHDRPTAICCANDLIALGMYQAFFQYGIKIPEDVSITGMDNIMYGDLCNPRLTTVTNDSCEFAKKSVEALMQRIRKEYEGEPREFLINRELIIRESTKSVKG